MTRRAEPSRRRILVVLATPCDPAVLVFSVSPARPRFKTMRRWDGVYHEVLNHRNTYTVTSDYTVFVHYRTTGHRYVTRKSLRVE